MSRSEEYELQYSPSRWSKRYRAEDIIEKHVAFAEKASKEAKQSVPCTLDVPYGPTERQKYDFFGTDLPKDAPLFVFIHGGFWQELNKDVSSYMVKPLYKNGFKVKIVGYDLCPQVALPEIVTQIQNFFLKCIEYAKVNYSRGIYLAGHSAGAHLIASLFDSFYDGLPIDDQNLVRAVFLISGIYNLSPLIFTYVNNPLNLDAASAKKLSPLYQRLTFSTNVKFFVIVGENDSPAFKEQSELFHEKLENLRNNSEFLIVKEVDHFDIVENLNDDNYEIVKLILSADDY